MKEKIKAYIELTKPRIMTLVVVTSALGYYLGSKGELQIFQLLYLLIGTSLVCAGSSTLNHYLERDYDKKMERTKKRPIPTGKISPQNALSFGIILTLSGVLLLNVYVNLLTAFLSLLTAFLYIVVYTPLKRISWLNTTIGSIPGAIPPMGGWAAATGTIDPESWILFLIMFLWQHPHFFAIAWMFKDDYKRGGFKMLPSIEEDGKSTFVQIFYFTAILIPVSLLPTILGMSGPIYFVGALISGIMLLNVSKKFIQTHQQQDARALLKATVYYLPVLLTLIVLDVTF